MIPTRRSSRSIGLLFSLSVLALSACSLTGTSTRSVSSGPPGSTEAPNPQANAPLTPQWQAPCGPATMMNQIISAQSMSDPKADIGPCKGEQGQVGLTKMANVQVQLKSDQAVMGMRPGQDMDLIAFADYQGPAVCFTIQPTAAYASSSGLPPMSAMSCANSVEFPGRWTNSVVGSCKAGACAYTLYAVCAGEPCKLGRVGFMLRPKAPAGPG